MGKGSFEKPLQPAAAKVPTMCVEVFNQLPDGFPQINRP